MSPTGSRASLRNRHQGPSTMGFKNEAEQSVWRPCRRTDGRSKRTCELASSTTARWSRSFLLSLSAGFCGRAPPGRTIPMAAGQLPLSGSVTQYSSRSRIPLIEGAGRLPPAVPSPRTSPAVTSVTPCYSECYTCRHERFHYSERHPQL
jgi:hypothetical protein